VPETLLFADIEKLGQWVVDLGSFFGAFIEVEEEKNDWQIQ
jgi:hypothetical protein